MDRSIKKIKEFDFLTEKRISKTKALSENREDYKLLRSPNLFKFNYQK